MSPDNHSNRLIPEAFDESLDTQGAMTLEQAGIPPDPEEAEVSTTIIPGNAESSETEDEDGGPSVDAPARQIQALPKMVAIKNLVREFQDKCQMSEAAAGVLASAVVEPSGVRRQLAEPQELRVLGGSFKVVHTRVWAHGVAPDPSNFRLVEIFGSPFLGKPLELRHTPIQEPTTTGPAGNELRLEVQSRSHLEAVAVAGYDKIQLDNPRVMESVPLQGVMMPVFGVVAEIFHQDTKASTWAVITPDGSSRVTACHLKLGISTGDVVYEYPNKPARARMLVDTARRVADTPMRSLSPEALVLNRVATLPMTLLVGFTPDPGSDQDFASAIRSLVGMLHVAPPTKWPAAGEREAMATAVVRSMEKHLSPVEIRFVLGDLRAADAEDAGFHRYLDQRTAYLLRLLTRPRQAPYRSQHDSISKGIRSVLVGQEDFGGKKAQATLEIRSQVAFELGLRPVREAGALPTKISTVRAALDRALPAELFRDRPWEPSCLGPDELLKKAMEELTAQGEPGPFIRSLAAMGIWWLCLTGSLARAKGQNQDSGDKDWREPSQLALDLARCPHGLWVFHSAIVAGRAAQDAGELHKLEIPAVTPEGEPEVSGDGKPQMVTPNWIRTQVVDLHPQNGSEGSDEPKVDPKALWNRRWSRFMADAHALHDGFFKEVLTGTLESGKPVVVVDGIPFDQAEAVEGILDKVTKKLGYYAEISKQKEQALQPDPEPLESSEEAD